MVIRRTSLLYKLLALVPVQCSPFNLIHARVGYNVDDYVIVVRRKF
jgi:hypothetical protein